MNRNQRRGRAPRRNESSNRFNAFKIKGASDIEEVHSPFRPRGKEKSVANRCCYVTPDQRDFGQSYGPDVASPTDHEDTGQIAHRIDQYQTMLEEQYGYDPNIPETDTKLKGLKKVLCDSGNDVETKLKYSHQDIGSSPAYVATSDGTQWRSVDNIEDIDSLIMNDDIRDTPAIYRCLPKHIFISEVPRVKIIAEKFSKYKRNNLELRQLDEKVVCVEYDVFDRSTNDVMKPMQRMRAFFSIKPAFDSDGGENNDVGTLPRLPSNIKHKFDILDEDLKKLTDKEIEIIDGKIEENKSYLEDLRRILKRKQVINAKKNKTSLDLQSLYEMAIRDGSPLGCDFSEVNFLSKAELQEVKDLILQRCTSSVHGIRRRRIKRREKESSMDVGVISESIVAELLREDAKLNV